MILLRDNLDFLGNAKFLVDPKGLTVSFSISVCFSERGK